MSVKLNPRQQRRKFEVLSRLLSARGQIKVVFAGAGACVNADRTVITVPAGDLSDPDFVELIEGLVDHEAGHCEETDSSATVQAVSEGKILNHIRNTFEDVRMEGIRMAKWAGARKNLLGTVKQAIKRGWFAEPGENEPVQALVLGLLLYKGRAECLDQWPLAPFAHKAEALLREQLPELTDKLVEIVGRIPGLKSNWDSLILAREVVELLKQEQQEQQEQQDQQQDQQQDGQDSESDEGDGDDQPEGSGGEADGDDDSDASDGDEDDAEGDGSDQDSESDEGEEDGQPDDREGNGNGQNDEPEQGEEDGQPSNGQPEEGNQGDNADGNQPRPAGGASSLAQQLQQLLDATEADLPKDLHDLLREEAEAMAEEAEAEGRVSAETEALPVWNDNPFSGKTLETGKIASLTRQVLPTMQRAMIDMAKAERRYDRRGGTIENRRLAGVPAGNLAVFKRESVEPAPTAAVTILVDRSGSTGNFIGTMATSAMVLAKSLERLDGVSSETIFYPNYKIDQNAGLVSAEGVYVAKSFTDKTVKEAAFNVMHCGGTPTGTAMVAAISRLSVQEKDKKVLILITDGDPDDRASVVEARQLAEQCGIKVVAFGVYTRRLIGFEDAEFVPLASLDELPAAVRGAVTAKLL